MRVHAIALAAALCCGVGVAPLNVAAVTPALLAPVLAPKPAPPVPRGPRIYHLPLPGGRDVDVCQGNNHDGGTHTGLAAYAWDFCMPVGSPVLAARGGTVRTVRQESNVGGWGARFAGDANYVVIDHGDGTSGLYMHLMLHGARVRVGQQVQSGQLIACSGNTGWTSAPHLHFMVMQTQADDYYSQSLPVLFSDVQSDGGLPLEDHWYRSENPDVDASVCSASAPPAFTPFWVESYRASSLWSGPDSKAVQFGPAAPWQYFEVTGPQDGPRLQVVVAATGAPAYIPAADVGPSGPPPGLIGGKGLDNPPPPPAPAVRHGPSDAGVGAGDQGGRTVTVSAHDTLFAIARDHGLTVDQLVGLNHLTDPNKLRLGQILKLS